MSSTIKILADHVINKIAAGEVVERPASVVKELIENSLDAGATEIRIDIEQAGKRLIRVTDNGSGMSREDARLAFERHATSKITTDADLEDVRTMGFRGETLSSIAAVAQVRMLTAEREASSGTLIEIHGGRIKAASEAAARTGTALEISHLFYNTPARLKFLKSPATEFSHILTAVSRQAMAHPSIGFRLLHNDTVVLDLPAKMSEQDRALRLYGADIAEHLFAFTGGRDTVAVHGLLGRPGFTRADKTYQEFYVNQRAVRNASLAHALYDAHGDALMRGRHPVGIIFLKMDPALVDVNVHPTKAEVRFRNQSQIHDLVRDAIRDGLRQAGLTDRGGAQRPEYTAEGVQEALADYGRSSGQWSLPETAAVLFGRRKNDMRPVDPQLDVTTSLFQDVLRTADLTAPTADSPLIPLTQIHNSFIIAQSREGMAIIDQHAAHERVLFERLQAQHAAAGVEVQELLLPLQLELGPAQSILLSEHLPAFRELGILVEDFGNGTFVIKAMPSLLTGADLRRLVLDILDEINAQGKGVTSETLLHSIFSVMACHPAIKVHRKLDLREMETLIEDLFQCRMPHTCPHGRPTVVRYSMGDLKRMFKRA